MIRGNIKAVPANTLEIVNQILSPYKVKIDTQPEKALPQKEQAPAMPPRTMSQGKAAKYFNITVQQMIRLVKAGKIKAHKTGEAKHAPVYIDLASAEAYFCGTSGE